MDPSEERDRRPPPSNGVLLLTRADIAALITLEDCIVAVEQAFRAHAMGQTIAPGLLHGDAPDGEFHIKAGGFLKPTPYYALKANAGFFGNTERFGLPNIQGLILLYSGVNGSPLAIMDSGGITVIRTGAATAVAARYLARPDSTVVGICGCGTQGRIQLRALQQVIPIRRVKAYSIDREQTAEFCTAMSDDLGVPVEPVADPASAVRSCDVCVTCTPSREYFVDRSFVAPGTLIMAVGADSPEKHEIDPRLLGSNAVVVDLLEQCATVGELHHAIAGGHMTAADVRAELSDLVAGRANGRMSADEILIFDSTGTALQDTAAAVLAYERAVASGRGSRFEFV